MQNVCTRAGIKLIGWFDAAHRAVYSVFYLSSVFFFECDANGVGHEIPLCMARYCNIARTKQNENAYIKCISLSENLFAQSIRVRFVRMEIGNGRIHKSHRSERERERKEAKRINRTFTESFMETKNALMIINRFKIRFYLVPSSSISSGNSWLIRLLFISLVERAIFRLVHFVLLLCGFFFFFFVRFCSYFITTVFSST